MAEMSLLVRQLMQTLRETREAVEVELDVQASAASSDPAPLLNLHQSVEEFRDQAASLAQMMEEQGAGAALVDEVADLGSYFENTERRILALLKVGRGWWG